MGLLIASCPLSLQVSFSPSIFSTFPLTSMYLLTNGAPLPKSIQATPFPSPQSSRPWLADYAACIVLCLHSRYALHRRCLHRHGPLLRMKVQTQFFFFADFCSCISVLYGLDFFLHNKSELFSCDLMLFFVFILCLFDFGLQ